MEIRNGAEEVKAGQGTEDVQAQVGSVPEKKEGEMVDFDLAADPNTSLPVAKKKEKRQTPKKGKKGKRNLSSPRPVKEKPMGKKKAEANAEKTQFSVDMDTAKAIRRFRAQLELTGDGERVTITEAIKTAVEAAMK